MDGNPLPRLTPDDPENLLSEDSRRRIGRARIHSESLRAKALADVSFDYSRNTRDDDPSDLSDHLRASASYREAALESIRIVLKAMWDEYAGLGLTAKRLREIMAEEIEAAINSYVNGDYPVSKADQNAFNLEVALWSVEKLPARVTDAGNFVTEQESSETHLTPKPAATTPRSARSQSGT